MANRKRVWLWVGLAAGAYLFYQFWQKRRGAVAVLPPIQPKAALPSGAKLTGRTQETMNNRPPNYPQEVVGFGKRRWAEIMLADGRTDWVEVAA
jgi:hypothetical protein